MNATLCAALTLALVAGAAADDDAQDQADSNWEYLAKKYDANSDGKISRKEYDRDDEHWKRLDADGDGFVTESEVETRRRGRPNRERVEPPKVGEKAPDFDLELLPPPSKEKEKEDAKPKKKKIVKVKLSSFARKKPVALIFGSYT